MTYPEQAKEFLWSDIHQISIDPKPFVKNPDSDFSRKRKLDFENLLRFLISMGSGTTARELVKYFNNDINAPSNSAFYQQRKKRLPDALQYLLFQFNSHFPFERYKGQYQLIACDGSEFNIARNPDDPDTFHSPSGKSTKGFNMIHTISLYDVLRKRYLECVIQPGRKKNEFRAFCDLIDRYSHLGTPIFITDRGFSSYNCFAHLMEKGAFFMTRSKDINTQRILGLKALPENLDVETEIILTRTQSKTKRQHPELMQQYRYINSTGSFDYIEPQTTNEYPLSLRVVRFEAAEGVYENITTNLPADEFPVDELKLLYHMRWGVETSFRDLKHTIGTINFHSKKVDYITQEIWARLILFNFCAIITNHVVIKQKNTKYISQINFAMAIQICHDFIRLRKDETVLDVEGLIGKYTLPIRPGRSYPRQPRFQLPASFLL